MTMAHDLLIKNGRVVDGSGMPAFQGDVAVKNGKIAELGKLSGPARRTLDAEGQVVSPGFVDNHCHFDAQVTWDPLCSFSPQHGATTVVFGCRTATLTRSASKSRRPSLTTRYAASMGLSVP